MAVAHSRTCGNVTGSGIPVIAACACKTRVRTTSAGLWHQAFSRHGMFGTIIGSLLGSLCTRSVSLSVRHGTVSKCKSGYI